MPQPSGAAVGGAVSEGLIVSAPIAPAVIPRPIAALVAKLPGSRQPWCDEITFGTSAATAPGAVVKLVFPNESSRSDQLRRGAGFDLQVNENGSGSMDGSTVRNAMPLAQALRLWFKYRPKQMRLTLAPGYYVSEDVHQAMQLGQSLPIQAEPGTLTIIASGNYLAASGGGTDFVFDPAGNLYMRGAHLPGITLLVRPGTTTRIRSMEFGRAIVRAGGRFITLANSNFATGYTGTEPSLSIEGEAVLMGFFSLNPGAPCLYVAKGAKVTGNSVGCQTQMPFGISVLGDANLGAVSTNTRSVPQTYIGPGGSLAVESLFMNDPGLQLGSLTVVDSGFLGVSQTLSSEGAPPVAVSVQGTGRFSLTGPNVSINTRDAARGIVLGDNARFEAAFPNSFAIATRTGTDCIGFTNPSAASLYSMPVNGNVTVSSDEAMADPTLGDPMTQADFAANAPRLERNALRARMREQIPPALRCSF